MKTIEMEHRKGLGTSCHHDISLASLQQTSSQDEGISCRRTGCGDGYMISETTEIVSNLLCVAISVVRLQACEMIISLLYLMEETFGDVHTSYGSARDEQHTGRLTTGKHLGDASILKGLTHGEHAHQGSTTHQVIRFQPQQL